MQSLSEIDDSSLPRKRLHITPFDQSLVDRFLPPSLRSVASDISFHAIQTFPERAFGYVELPAMEADKLKKKLNGATLKGVKVRIEDAKPEKRRKSDSMEKEEDGGTRKTNKKQKLETDNLKGVGGVMAGVELPLGRKVKRGWSEAVTQKKRKKDTTNSDAGNANVARMKFKTALPANAPGVEIKPKKKDEKKRQGSQTKQKAVVEEFGKTRKITAPVEGNAVVKVATRYIDGEGWVDEDGAVVEATPQTSKRRSQRIRGEAENNNLGNKTSLQPTKHTPDSQNDNLQASAAQAGLDDESLQADGSQNPEAEVVSANAAESLDDAPRTPPATGSTAIKEVHPLEALFKRPPPKVESSSKPKPAPIDTSFAFFASGEAENDNGQNVTTARPPQTPFTKEDMEWRSIRSAAPTPDTAAIGRKFSFPFARGADDEDESAESEEESEDNGGEGDAADAGASRPGAQGAASNERREESEFRKWFFDNRGDLNRSWKKRRREERKSKRQRENRRMARRIV